MSRAGKVVASIVMTVAIGAGLLMFLWPPDQCPPGAKEDYTYEIWEVTDSTGTRPAEREIIACTKTD